MPAATAADPRQRAQQAVRQLNSLATLPEVVGRVMTMVEDPKTTPAALQQAVSHDPALVARILRIVNSSFYGLPTQVGSVDRAIVLLGLNAVKNIAVAASLGQLFRGGQLCPGFAAKDVWKHCLAVAVAARELARPTSRELGEMAFLAGMVHDTGLLVSMQLWPEKLRAACAAALQRGAQTAFCDIELEQLGLDHQLLGAELAAQWKFPPACAAVAGHHHDNPAIATADSPHAQLVAVVHAADVLCCQSTRFGFNLTAQHTSLDTITDFDRETLDAVAAKMDNLMAAAGPLLA